MYSILESDLQNQQYSSFNEPIQSLSKEDIATILDVFENVLRNYNSSNIKDLLKNENGFFLFVVGKGEGNFDLYSYLNNYSIDKTIAINCVNARSLFPKELSRGEYVVEAYTQISDYNSDSTDILSTEQIDGLTKLHQLLHMKTGNIIQITNMGITFGRSSKDANYVIEGNSNITRCHALVYVYEDNMYVRDNNSTNGTYVNNKQAAPQIDVKLNVGDEVRFADEKFVVK